MLAHSDVSLQDSEISPKTKDCLFAQDQRVLGSNPRLSRSHCEPDLLPFLAPTALKQTFHSGNMSILMANTLWSKQVKKAVDTYKNYTCPLVHFYSFFIVEQQHLIACVNTGNLVKETKSMPFRSNLFSIPRQHTKYKSHIPSFTLPLEGFTAILHSYYGQILEGSIQS